MSKNRDTKFIVKIEPDKYFVGFDADYCTLEFLQTTTERTQSFQMEESVARDYVATFKEWGLDADVEFAEPITI